MNFVGVPHRKQFLIGPKSLLSMIDLPSRFREINLDHGLSIRFCPDLKTTFVRNVEGNLILLIGTVVEAHPEKTSPQNVLSSIDHFNLEVLTATWSGHWLLVIGEFIYGDCCGLLSLYLPRPHLLDKFGTLFFSNSPVLISQIYGLEISKFQPKMIAPMCMAPTTFLPDIRTMLAGERINLRTSERSFPFVLFKPRIIDLDEIRHNVTTFIKTAITRLHLINNDKLLCALSGGFDSRLNLSGCMASGVPFQAYTFKKPYFYITEADRLLPPKIAKSVNVQHKMISASTFSLQRSLAYIEHSGGMISSFPGSGYDHYVYGYWHQAGIGKTVIDGQCYELAVNYHRLKFPENFTHSDLNKFGFKITYQDFVELQDYWKNQPLSEKLDRRDLIFWTANINGVYSRMTQEHDLFVDLFYPACNREQFNLLLSVPKKLREACNYQKTLTALLFPDLDFFPYNPPEPLFKRIIKRARYEALKFMDL